MIGICNLQSSLGLSLGMLICYGSTCCVAAHVIDPSNASDPADQAAIIRYEIGRTLDDYLTRMEAFGFHGAMLVEVDGEVVLARGYGIADRSTGTSITTHSLFDIGSLGKQFLAAGALLLESRGRLSVTDRISEHLQNVPEDKSAITIHQLLTHTAGLPYLPSVEDALDEPLTSEPGEHWAYSNVGYVVLGRVLDVVAGEPFEDFLTREVFRGLEMEHTWFRKDLPEMQPRMARAYTDDTAQGTPAEMQLPAGLRGAGDVVSTIGDLLRWEHALRTHALLDEPTTKRFFAEHARNDADTMGYAYGWMIFRTLRGTRVVAHAGNYGGFNCDYRRYIDENMTIVCLSNHFINGRSMRDAVMNNISLIVIGDDVTWPPQPIAAVANENALHVRAGEYAIHGGTIFVERIDNHLQLRSDSQPAMTAVFLPDASDSEHAFAEFACRESDRVVRALMNGETAPFLEHISRSLPRSAADRVAERCAAMIEAEGPFVESESVGTMLVSDGNGRAAVRATFERGERLIQLTWAGRHIIHFAEIDQPAARTFLPIDDGSFAAYDIFTNRSATLRFTPDGNDTIKLTIQAGPHTHTATTRVTVDAGRTFSVME